MTYIGLHNFTLKLCSEVLAVVCLETNEHTENKTLQQREERRKKVLKKSLNI